MDLECIEQVKAAEELNNVESEFTLSLDDEEEELDVQGIVALGVIVAVVIITIIFVLVVWCCKKCDMHKSDKV